jgi:2'-5' RNA ligase
MSAYEPFLDDANHIARLDRQRFVVVRAPVPLARAYRDVQSRVRDNFAGWPISYPAQPHVTLCGFVAGTSLAQLQNVVRLWAAQTPPFGIAISGVNWFAAPFQIVVVEVRRTNALVAALTSLRAGAEREGLEISNVVPVDQWRFHMSVAYCSELSESQWQEVVGLVETWKAPTLHEIANTVEVVAFDRGEEYSGGSFELAAPVAL